jgi:hypothetical protein
MHRQRRRRRIRNDVRYYDSYNYDNNDRHDNSHHYRHHHRHDYRNDNSYSNDNDKRWRGWRRWRLKPAAAERTAKRRVLDAATWLLHPGRPPHKSGMADYEVQQQPCSSADLHRWRVRELFD